MTGTVALALLIASGSGAVPSPPEPEPLLEALRAETARSLAGLRDPAFADPYYLSASVTSRRVVTLEAVGTSLLPRLEARQRVLRVTVRVGSYDLDNSGFVDQVGGTGSGEEVTTFPLDDDPVAMRRALWLAFDDGYKEAGATFAAKQSFLSTQGGAPDGLGDFTREPARRERLPVPSIAADEARLEPLVRRLAAAAASGPDPTPVRLRVSLVERRTTFVDSEGSELDSGSTFAALEAVAWDEAEGGMPVRDLLMRYAPTLDRLGKPEDLEREAAALGASVRAQVLAPELAEPYHGPVLFEGDACGQLFATLLLPRLSQPREPLSASGSAGGVAGEWANRLNSRVLSASLSVADDPTLGERGGIPLIGGYRFDSEGVLATPVTLVTKGVLKDFVGTRWPRKGAPRSNGHARRVSGASYNLGAVPFPSNLIITGGDGAVGNEEARLRLLEEVRARELPYGLCVRRLDDSSLLQLGATDRFEASDLLGRVHQDSDLEMPVALYRVTPDGKEERLRGARFGKVPPETLRNLLAVSAPEAGEVVHGALVTFDLGYSITGPTTSSYLPFSVVAPGRVLLEEADLLPIPGPFGKKPLAAARRRVPAPKR